MWVLPLGVILARNLLAKSAMSSTASQFIVVRFCPHFIHPLCFSLIFSLFQFCSSTFEGEKELDSK